MTVIRSGAAVVSSRQGPSSFTTWQSVGSCCREKRRLQGRSRRPSSISVC